MNVIVETKWRRYPAHPPLSRHAASVPALAHIHRMLRKAVEASRTSANRPGATRAAGSGGDSDDDDDDSVVSGPSRPAASVAAPPAVEPAARDAELLAAMQASAA